MIGYWASGGCLMGLFSFGDLKKQIAFLLDVGGGWTGAINSVCTIKDLNLKSAIK